VFYELLRTFLCTLLWCLFKC